MTDQSDQDLALDSKAASTASDKNAKPKSKSPDQASVSETLSFVFGSGTKTAVIFCIGIVGGIGNGAVYPVLAYLFSSAFTDISSASAEGTDQVKELAFTFLVVGAWALVMGCIQTTCFEVVAYKASQNLRLQWFHALLRQDSAFFDVHDIGGIASNVGPSANRYRRGVGRKFGEGIQFLTTGIGGIGYAMYASWRVALVVLAITPLISLAALSVVTLNQSKSQRAAKAYSR
jgi:ATP-binding cassette subfamily B (MDR/TAP) protein 1